MRAQYVMNSTAHVMGGEGCENTTHGNHLLCIGVVLYSDGHSKFRPSFGSNRIPHSTGCSGFYSVCLEHFVEFLKLLENIG